MPVRTAWPHLAWVFDPNAHPHVGMAHATYTRSQVALCGADTPYLGDAWPKVGEPWSSVFCRCPSCAHRLYAGRF